MPTTPAPRDGGGFGSKARRGKSKVKNNNKLRAFIASSRKKRQRRAKEL
jgi:hypothetical protein